MSLTRPLALTAASALLLGGLALAPTAEATVDPGIITTYAGGGDLVARAGTAIDQAPVAMAVSATTVYIGDYDHRVIRALDRTTGIETVYAGTGGPASSMDGPAALATFNQIAGLALAPNGDLYVIDSSVVRKIDHVGPDHTVTKVAGNGSYTPEGDTGLAVNAGLSPSSIAVGPVSGDLYIADAAHNTIRRVNHTTGIITRYAGNGTYGTSGDSASPVAATSVPLDTPISLAFDPAENLFFPRQGPNRIDVVTYSSGNLTKFSNMSAWAPIALDSLGNLLYLGPGTLYRLAVTGGVAGAETDIGGSGNSSIPTASGEGGRVRDADLSTYGVIATGSNGDVFLASTQLRRVGRVSVFPGNDAITQNDTFTRVAGGFPVGENGPATNVGFTGGLDSIEANAEGDLLLSDFLTGSVRRVDHATGFITTVAGRGYSSTSSGDGGQATAAVLDTPGAVAFLPNGDVIISEIGRLRRVNHTTRVITTILGNGTNVVDGGNGGDAAAATMGFEFHKLAVNADGDIFFTDGNRIRRIDHATNVVTRYAGTGVSTSVSAPAGNGGPAINATFSGIDGLAIDPSTGQLLIPDFYSGVIRTVNGAGTISILASVAYPVDVDADSQGNLYVTTSYNGVLKLPKSASFLPSALTDTTPGFSGDGGPSTSARVQYPGSIAVDGYGNLAFVDSPRIRRIERVAAGLPFAPTGLATPTSSHRIDLSWVAPTWTGNLPLTGYAITVDPALPVGGACAVLTPTTGACTGLDNGVYYTVTLRAVNAAGAGDPVVQTLVRPLGNPTEPQGVLATRGDRTIGVRWTEPIDTGGDAIYGYEAYAVDAANLAGTRYTCVYVGLPSLTAQCPGLAPGTTYRVFVRAYSDATGVLNRFYGPYASADATAGAAPSAPRSVTAVGRNGAVQVSWAAPADAGTPALTGYTANATAPGQPKKSCVATAPARTCTITGLVNGKAYSIRVSAANAVTRGGALSAAITATPRIPITVSWSVTGRSVTARFTRVAGPASYRLVSTGATKASASCTRAGTRYTCRITLAKGLSTLHVDGLTAAKVAIAASANRSQRVR